MQKKNTLLRSAQPLKLYFWYFIRTLIFLCIFTFRLFSKGVHAAYFFLVGTQRETSSGNPPNRGQVGWTTKCVSKNWTCMLAFYFFTLGVIVFCIRIASDRWRCCMFLPACFHTKRLKDVETYLPWCDRVTTVCRVPTRTKQLSWSTRPGVVHYSWTPRFLMQKKNTLLRSAQPLKLYFVILYGR